MDRKTMVVVCLALVGNGCAAVTDRAANGTSTKRDEVSVRPIASGVPANMRVPDVYRDLVDGMWLRSPTFRRQCARIELAGHLVVILEEQPMTPVSTHRARTAIEPRAGGLRVARVALNPQRRDQFVELIAHELEHIVEWLDGVDYTTLSGESGVRHGTGGAVETIRAITIGRQVADEVATANGMTSARANAASTAATGRANKRTAF